MLSGAKYLYRGARDPSVAEKRSLRVTYTATLSKPCSPVRHSNQPE